MHGCTSLFVALGMLVLALYGAVVNLVPIDFSRLCGVYVGVFALVSVLFGRLWFAEQIAPSTWVGPGVVLPRQRDHARCCRS